MKNFLLPLVFLLSLLLSACTAPISAAQPTSPSQPAPGATPIRTDTPLPTLIPTPTVVPTLASPGALLQSQTQRNLSPQIEPADLQALVQGNSVFAVDLYQRLRAEEGNQFFSPLSISMALAITYAGARGETEAQVAQTLHFALSQDRLHPAFNDLSLQLTAQQAGGQDKSQPFQLSIANSLWGERTFAFLPEFLDVIALNYGAGLRLLDFAGAPEASRRIINDWVFDETQEKIEDLIPQNAIKPETRLVLANAIYFKADWLYPFSHKLTQNMPFNLLDGGQSTAAMMRMSNVTKLYYAAGDGFQAVELPYVGDRISMLVLAPDLGKFTDFEAGLSAAMVASIRGMLEERKVALLFPKFSFEQEFSLAETLQQMGMPVAFEFGQADFSGMDGSRELAISDVFHKAFVAVDEKGTEAAAATAVIVFRGGLGPDVELIVDRPFIFMIQDQSTGSVLFMGRVLDPSQ